ncbi:nuclear transport factor 2 family protein [Serratia grimesii]|uniref:nuclear transport factor 2 family protein n=1 Tax=Serratia grimesii TaxID=82995 RepID=UPI0039B11234
MSKDNTTYSGSTEPRQVAEFVCNAVNGWTEDPVRMLPYFTEDGGWEFPFAPEEFGLFFKELKGKETMKNYFTSLTPYMEKLDVGPPSHWGANKTDIPGTYIFTYTGTAIIKPSGKIYNQNYIAIVTLHQGKIKNYREYWDPYVALLDFNLVAPVPTNQ